MIGVLKRHPVACTLAAGAGVAYLLQVVFVAADRPEMSALMGTPFWPIHWALEPWKGALVPILGVLFERPEIEAIFDALSVLLGVVLYWGAGRGVEVLWGRLFRPTTTLPGQGAGQ